MGILPFAHRKAQSRVSHLTLQIGATRKPKETRQPNKRATKLTKTKKLSTFFLIFFIFLKRIKNALKKGFAGWMKKKELNGVY
jgi:hypothetical protein